jgi:hypothetical protein
VRERGSVRARCGGVRKKRNGDERAVPLWFSGTAASPERNLFDIEGDNLCRLFCSETRLLLLVISRESLVGVFFSRFFQAELARTAGGSRTHTFRAGVPRMCQVRERGHVCVCVPVAVRAFVEKRLGARPFESQYTARGRAPARTRTHVYSRTRGGGAGADAAREAVAHILLSGCNAGARLCAL